ncbi:MAG: D-alanyl-D-alanine carboxypeptidase/D-alanyl-D-alanine-endopeptidase [Acidobacteria bacterium]|nr:D-alanyl-D-alanine carboxypeptidase/D-alanyl-D-alanine-endopeptidase [Acidobacteriota bacterium]
MFTQRARLSAAALFLTVTLATHAQDTALQAKIDAMIHEPQVARAHWGIHVTKLDGTPIVAINEGQLFQPASNNKLFTTATVMALLPTETQRFVTTVKGEGVFEKDGVLRGRLMLIGGGDANLSGRTLPYVPPALRPTGPQPPPNELRYIGELADQIKAKGITRVEGDVIGDDIMLPWEPYANDWSIDDAVWYYGAPVNALMIADNAINLKIMPGAKVGDSATIVLNPSLPYYTIASQLRTVAKGEETHYEIQRTIGSRTLRLYGTIAIGHRPISEDIAIEDPAEYAAFALKNALEERGIPVTGKVRTDHRIEPTLQFTKEATAPIKHLEPLKSVTPEQAHFIENLDPYFGTIAGFARPETRVLANHYSAPLYEDVVVTNKVSQNQHAELMLRLLGGFFGSKDDCDHTMPVTVGSIAQGARVVRSFLTTKVGIDPDDFIFYDGSGLSGHDLVTTRAITQLLRYAVTQPWGEKWKASLPVGGEDGTLRSRFPKEPIKGHLHAKTGTLSEARALSGYLDCASGQTVVFSIMVNNHTPRTHEDEKIMDAIVAVIQAAE